jgi:hypothetical protein
MSAAVTEAPRGLDNLVIMFDALDDAISRYRALGFTVVPGGKHANGTEVALVSFADGTYLQLMAFHTPSPAHRWWEAKERGGGLIGLCVRTETIADDVAAIQRAGVPIGEPERGGRTRPDGYRVEWSMASSPEPFVAETAVIVQDHTPRDERIPRDRTHANGVTGIRSITIASGDVPRIRAWWSAFLRAPGVDVERADLDATGVRFEAGRHAIELLGPKRASGPLAEWLAARGPSPYAADLMAPPGAAPLDARQAGARIRIV